MELKVICGLEVNGKFIPLTDMADEESLAVIRTAHTLPARMIARDHELDVYVEGEDKDKALMEQIRAKY